MDSEDFKVGDLVWAKMKGYPPWPARIAEPQSDAKPPKSKKSHYVIFFGTEDCAWILDENISPHSESILNSINKKKSGSYQNAIDALISYSKNNKKEKQNSPKTKKENDNRKSQTKVVKIFNSVSKKHERKVLTNKSSPHKKLHKKRSAEIDVNGDGSCSPSKSRKLNASDYLHSTTSESTYNNSSISLYEKYLNSVELKHVHPTSKKIGFIGLGHMGKAIIKNLLQSKHHVTIWNRSQYKCDAFAKLGAGVAKSVCDLVKACDITFCCVSDPEASKTLIFGERGVLKGLEQSPKNMGVKGYVELTTIDPDTSLAISDAITTKQGRYLEAPFCGNSKNAADGSLLILASGDRRLFLDCITCFHAMGKHAYYVSCDVGYGSRMSLLLSMVCGTVCAAVAEALVLAQSLNLHNADFLKVLNMGPLQCESIMDKCEMMCNRRFEAVTPLKHIQKDLNLALMLGDSLIQPMPVTAAANEVYKRARLRNYSDSDMSAVYKVVRN